MNRPPENLFNGRPRGESERTVNEAIGPERRRIEDLEERQRLAREIGELD